MLVQQGDVRHLFLLLLRLYDPASHGLSYLKCVMKLNQMKPSFYINKSLYFFSTGDASSTRRRPPLIPSSPSSLRPSEPRPKLLEMRYEIESQFSDNV